MEDYVDRNVILNNNANAMMNKCNYILDVLNISDQIKLCENRSIILKQNVNLMWDMISFRKGALIYKCTLFLYDICYSVMFNRNND